MVLFLPIPSSDTCARAISQLRTRSLCDIIFHQADLHAPVKRRRIRGVPLPWLNDTISEVMKDRDFHHRKAVKTCLSLEF